MKNFLLSKNIRSISLISSLIIVIISFISIIFFESRDIIIEVLLIFITYIISLLISDFNFKIKELFNLFIIPSLIIFLFYSFILRYDLLHQSIYLVIFIGLIYFIFLYASFIHISIINVSKFESVPLASFSYTINYIILTVISYFSFLFGFLQNNIFLLILYIVIFSIIIISQNLTSLEYDSTEINLYSAIGALMFFNLTIFFIFYPIYIFIAALSLALVMYIYNGILLHNRTNRIPYFNYIEYLIFSIIIVLSLIYIPSWGISGHL